MRRARRQLAAAIAHDRVGLAVVLLAPLIAVVALRAPLVNALSYRDPWFYTGHGWHLANHVENFGFFYYGVRFPVTLPIDWSAALLGPVGGYVALRYVILVATGALVYAVFRRFATRPVAACAVLLVALTPFYLRGVLWDYTTFVAIPASVAAVAVWHLGPSGRVAGAGAGGLVAAAMFANPISFPIVVSLFGVEAVQALRDGRAGVRAFLARVAWAVGGAVLVFLAGWIAYRLTLGPLTPADLVRPTLDFIEANDERSSPFQIPASEWLRDEPRVYAPVVVVLALVVAMRGALLGRDLPARLAQVAIAYTAVLWLYRWLVTSSIVETWWAYTNATVTIVLGLGVLAHVWSRRGEEGAGHPRAAVAMVAGAAVAGFAIRALGDDAVSAYDEVRESVPLLLALLALTTLAAVVASSGARARVTATAAAALSALVMMWGLAPADYLGVASTGEFSPFSGDDELDLYGAAADLLGLIAPRDEPDAHVMLLSDLRGPAMIGWVNMPHVGGALQNPDLPETMTELTPADVALLHHPTTRELVVLAPTRTEVDAALPALRGAGAVPRLLDRGEWADGRLHWMHLDVGGAGR